MGEQPNHRSHRQRRAEADDAGSEALPPPPSPPPGPPQAPAAFTARSVVPGREPQPEEEAEPTDNPVARALGLSLLAVLVVAAVVVAVLAVYRQQDDGGSAGPSPSTTHSTSTAAEPSTASPSTTTSPSPSAAPSLAPSSATASATASARPTTSVKPTSAAKPTAISPAKTTPTQPALTGRPPVLVLNNSRVHGLANVAADDLRKRGWTVSGVGNLTGRLPATTLYYGPHQEQQARALAEAVRGVERILPQTTAIPGSGLTLVVTRHYPH